MRLYFDISAAFGYNERGEVVFSRRDAESAEDAYSYDDIGNLLTSAFSGGITNAYTSNSQNQYSSIQEISALSAPLREINYDADGNLLSDGAYIYSYDAENRLVAVYPLSPAAGSLAVENRHDHGHRRVRKVIKRFDGAAWETVETHTFVWDGNNIVLEKVGVADGTTRIFEYYWGADKSGTEQGAGGVEGLLAMSVDGVFYIPCYDHNGNIVLYVSESGAIAAQYTYDPYGNIVDSNGTLADVFPFGFSTKYHDREIGMIGYQQRVYSPVLGRWLNRDPIEESGGENLYAFCANAPVMYIDILGNIYWKRVFEGLLQVASGGFMMFTAITTEVGTYGMTTPLSYALGLWGATSIANGIQTVYSGIRETKPSEPLQVQFVEYAYKTITGNEMSNSGKTITKVLYYGIDISLSCYTISVSWRTMIEEGIIYRRYFDEVMYTPSGFGVIKVSSELRFLGHASGAGGMSTSVILDYRSIFLDVYEVSDELGNVKQIPDVSREVSIGGDK